MRARVCVCMCVSVCARVRVRVCVCPSNYCMPNLNLIFPNHYHILLQIELNHPRFANNCPKIGLTPSITPTLCNYIPDTPWITKITLTSSFLDRNE